MPRAFINVVTKYIKVFFEEAAVNTADKTFWAQRVFVNFYIFTKHFGLAVVRTAQHHIGTAFAADGKEMGPTLTDLQHTLTAMFLVGAVHLQLPYLSALLLQVYVRKVSTATVRAGIGILRPPVKTAFTEASFTAVDKMRLTQDFQTNRTC